MEAKAEAGSTEMDSLVSQSASATTLLPIKQPWFVWPVLLLAVLAVSSAATAFKAMADVPPLTLAAWRFQLTSGILLPLAAHEMWRMPRDTRTKLHRSAWLVAGSGTCLAIQMACWVSSIELTSLTHALLCVSTESLAIALGMWVLRQPISIGELLGTAVGFAGAALLAVDAVSEQEVTLVGDAFGIAAAVAIIGYLMAGKTLRKWMPIFTYSFFVTGWATCLLAAGAVLIERAPLLGRFGLLGWTARDRLLGIAYLAIVPGIVGHMGINMVLRWMAPLLITLTVATEPLIGSGIGWAAGLAPTPGVFTFLGGAILLASVAWVTVAGHRREVTAAATDTGRLKRINSLQGTTSAPLPVVASPHLPVVIELEPSEHHPLNTCRLQHPVDSCTAENVTL